MEAREPAMHPRSVAVRWMQQVVRPLHRLECLQVPAERPERNPAIEVSPHAVGIDDQREREIGRRDLVQSLPSVLVTPQLV